MGTESTYGTDSFGNPITEEYVAELVAEAEGDWDSSEFRPVGRPSLTGEQRHSPRVTFRVPDTLRERAEAEAARRGCTVSQLAREALERYLAS